MTKLRRHSKATHLVSAGVPLHVIAQLLGHSSVTTTEIYANVTAKTQADALARVDNAALRGLEFKPEEEEELLAWFDGEFVR